MFSDVVYERTLLLNLILMLDSNLHLIPTMIGFGTSIGFMVYICTRLICSKARTFHPQRDSTVDVQQQPPQISIGLEPIVFSAIPTIRFNRDAFVFTEDSQCAICIEEYEEKERMKIMPKCLHKFHAACIDLWLSTHSTCPICRYDQSLEVD